MTASGGFEVAFSSAYREIDRPHRLVKSEVLGLVPDGEAVSTTPFEEARRRATTTIPQAMRRSRSTSNPERNTGG
jgi:hypothetical protein